MIALQVARRDLLEMSRDGRLRWAVGVLLLLLAVSVCVGWTRSTQAAALRRAATDVQHEAWLEKGAMHPHMAAHYGMFLFKPVPPLAAVDRGIDDYVGSFVFLEAHKQNLFAGRPAADAPPGARFGELTAAAALQVLVPLVILLLTFSTFAGEREQGTLRQTLATGVRGWELVLGKTVSNALSGTDLAHHRRFAAAAEAYRLDLVQPLNRAIAVNDEIAQRPGDETFYAGYLRGRDLWAELPRFEYVRPPLAWAASYTWTSTATLLLWLTAATAGLLASVRRLHV